MRLDRPHTFSPYIDAEINEESGHSFELTWCECKQNSIKPANEGGGSFRAHPVETKGGRRKTVKTVGEARGRCGFTWLKPGVNDSGESLRRSPG